MLQRALALGRPGPYLLQAVIAAGHAENVGWDTIARAYAELEAIDRSPVVRLNSAVAVALAGDVDRGLAMIDGIEGLAGYSYLHAARADLLRRAGRERARRPPRTGCALELTANEAERRFLSRRLAGIAAYGSPATRGPRERIPACEANTVSRVANRPLASAHRLVTRPGSLAAHARTPIAQSLVGKTAEAATLVALTLLVPRLLGPSDYGTFAVALAIVTVVSSSLTLGGPTLLSRFVPAAAPADRRPIARALVARILRVRALQVLVVVAVATVLTLAAPDRFGAAVTALVALAVVLEIGATFGYQIALGLGHTSLWSFRYAMQNTVLFAATLVLYEAAGATGAIGGITLASAVALVVGATVAVRELRGVVAAPSIPPGAIRFSVMQSIGGFFSLITTRGVPIAVIVLTGSEREAGYAALASGVALAGTYAVWQAFLVELPRLSASVAQAGVETEAAARRLAARATAVLIPLGIASALLVGWGLPLVVGEEFVEAAPAFGPALAILPLAAVGALASQVAALRLQPGVRAVGSAAGATAFVVTALVAVPAWEATGGTAALLAGVATTVIVGVARLPGAAGSRLLAAAFAGSLATLVIGVA